MCGCEPGFVCSTHRALPDYRCDHYHDGPERERVDDEVDRYEAERAAAGEPDA